MLDCCHASRLQRNPTGLGVTHFHCHVLPNNLLVTLFHTIAASRGVMKPLREVWIGDEYHAYKCKEFKKRRLLVRRSLRLCEHERSELYKMRRAPGPRGEYRASSRGAARPERTVLSGVRASAISRFKKQLRENYRHSETRAKTCGSSTRARIQFLES